ncbi:hypothetical protein COH21_007674 [Aspergillus flavus]|uniref:Dimethylaniline monooxygenase n=1 Tax=Aspergillus flavus TaxID=5059 RepID=A0AB74CFZ4_ASPFL|nr:hypothetical protein NYO67_10709 [Aspergillus flavus]RAQ44561.1 hypothetical protein AFGD_007906 [Aspergillus flavus]RAQ64350.1 hypothetical protein COH21_007674 [Aspergillus flavus]RMZ45584.1 hypothetical protein CA14_005557 [Aspergillus flavus]
MVSPRYKRVALVGGGPAGLAAIRELVQEQCFDYIRVFERKDRVGEIWSAFNLFSAINDSADFSKSAKEKPGLRSPIYETLDTNAGARTMAAVFADLILPFIYSSIQPKLWREFFAGRSGGLPEIEEQGRWDKERLECKGPTELFHEVKPDFAEYYGWLRELAGVGECVDGLGLPEFQPHWVDSDLEILFAKSKYWGTLRSRPT